MPLIEISQWIEDKSSWVIGTNLFVGHLPAKRADKTDPPIRCVVLLENAPGALVGELPDRIDKPIQIWNRSKDFGEARNDAKALFELIHGTAGWNLPVIIAGVNYLAMVVDAVASPAPIENPDKHGNFIFSCNFIWMIERASCG